MNENLVKFYENKDEKERKKLIDIFLNDYEEILFIVLKNILNKIELRSNAYILNLMSKKKKVNEILNKNFKKEHLDVLLNDSDPKTRKNTYIFMGNFINKDYVIDLIKMLKKEEINYCISSLILTLGNYKIKNIEEIMSKYQEILHEKLVNNLIEKVHYDEIINNINKVLNKSSKVEFHVFNELDREVYLYLTCMEPLINSSFNDIKKGFKDARKYQNGIVIKSNDLDKVYSFRTFYEALVSYGDSFGVSINELKGNIISFLKSNILENSHFSFGIDNFTYRIEYQSIKPKQEKEEIYKLVNDLINKEFNGKYINNPSQYEFEIRIIDNNDKFNILYKLCTYKDKRFDYRVNDLPASINPISAAIMLNEVGKYLNANSKVLDPFCGTSTMLIERSYIGKCDLSGVDISNDAIEFSKNNSRTANIKINLYKQNCLEHKGYYDEIISNMPYGNRVGTHKSNELLYKDFISKLSSLLNDGGVAILLTSEIALMKKILKNKTKLKLIKDIYCETGGLTPHLFVIKKV